MTVIWMIHPRYQGAILIYFKYLQGRFKQSEELFRKTIANSVIAFKTGLDLVVEKVKNLVIKDKKRVIIKEEGTIEEASNYTEPEIKSL